ncbi:MAG: choice-of-anchor D domain-containing protein [Betaproteobacteria bacterium]
MKHLALLAILLACSGAVPAQDALAGKRLYFDAARVRGTAASCVDCHFGLPGAFGIGSAANDPARVQRAIDTIAQMSLFRGRLTQTDYADIAAYLGRPDVPSPNLRVSTSGAALDRIDFGMRPAGSTATGQLRLANTGQLPLRFTSAARIVGEHAADYTITASNCTDVFAPGASCSIDVRFAPPPGASGSRRAALQIEHDWIGGLAAAALLGQAEAMGDPAAPPIGPPGGGAEGGSAGGSGGGAAQLGWLLVLLLAVALRGRTARRGSPTVMHSR